MNFFKKQKTGFYGLLAAAVLVIVGIIVFEVSYKQGYEFFAQQNIDAGMQVPLFGILAILLMVAAVAINQFDVDGAAGKVLSIVADLALIGAGVLIGVAFVCGVGAYAYDAAIWLGSDLHNGDDAIINAIQVGMASSAIMILGILVAGVTTCFSITKK